MYTLTPHKMCDENVFPCSRNLKWVVAFNSQMGKLKGQYVANWTNK